MSVPCMGSVRMAMRMVMCVSVSRRVCTRVLAIFAVVMAVRVHLRYCTYTTAALALVVLLVRQFDTPALRIN